VLKNQVQEKDKIIEHLEVSGLCVNGHRIQVSVVVVFNHAK